MLRDLNLIKDQMRSDFETVMLAFSVQKKAMQEQSNAVEEQRKAMEQQRKAMEQQRKAMEVQEAATGRQSTALQHIGERMNSLVVTVENYYQDHEMRLQAIEEKLSA